jgi:hypothetical protein
MQSLVDTVLFHIDAMTGREVTGFSTDKVELQGQDIISGPLTESFFLDADSKMVILLDEFLQVGPSFSRVMPYETKYTLGLSISRYTPNSSCIQQSIP